MTPRLLLSLGLFVLAGCSSSVVRNKDTYQMEVKLMSEFSRQQGDLLTTWIGEQCTCTPVPTQAFSTPLCQKSAETVVLAQARVPWHAQMMLLNARIVDQDPGEAPTPPAPTSLCPAPKGTK